MKVWIDQDLCTGDGLCEEICPSVFKIHSDGLAYVKDLGATAFTDEEGNPVSQGAEGVATVAPEDEGAVIEASQECPGECIFIIEHNKK